MFILMIAIYSITAILGFCGFISNVSDASNQILTWGSFALMIVSILNAIIFVKIDNMKLEIEKNKNDILSLQDIIYKNKNAQKEEKVPLTNNKNTNNTTPPSEE